MAIIALQSQRTRTFSHAHLLSRTPHHAILTFIPTFPHFHSHFSSLLFPYFLTFIPIFPHFHSHFSSLSEQYLAGSFGVPLRGHVPGVWCGGLTRVTMVTDLHPRVVGRGAQGVRSSGILSLLCICCGIRVEC